MKNKILRCDIEGKKYIQRNERDYQEQRLYFTLLIPSLILGAIAWAIIINQIADFIEPLSKNYIFSLNNFLVSLGVTFIFFIVAYLIFQITYWLSGFIKELKYKEIK